MHADDYIRSSSGQTFLLNFSSSSQKIESVEDVEEQVNFSNAEVDISDPGEVTNFSVVNYLRDHVLPPRRIVKKRVLQVIRYINSSSVDKSLEVRGHLIEYINSFLYNVIFKYMSGTDDTVSKNLILALGLNSISKDLSSAKSLQRTLRLVKKQLSTHGSIRPELQKKMKKEYSDMFSEIINYIDEHVSENKKGIITGELSSEDQI